MWSQNVIFTKVPFSGNCWSQKVLWLKKSYVVDNGTIAKYHSREGYSATFSSFELCSEVAAFVVANRVQITMQSRFLFCVSLSSNPDRVLGKHPSYLKHGSHSSTYETDASPSPLFERLPCEISVLTDLIEHVTPTYKLCSLLRNQVKIMVFIRLSYETRLSVELGFV